VNSLDGGQLSFSDICQQTTGIAGTTGIWGTLPAALAARPRSLTPTSLKREAARLIGAEKAEELLRAIMA